MSNPWDEIRAALVQARQINDACDRNVTAMAALITGRLRKADRWTLKALKRELRDFNIQTGEWK